MVDNQEIELKNVDYVPSELDDFYSDESLYNINSWGADLSFRELIERYKEGSIIKPEIQRNYVWDKAEASRFIDSILLGLPVPSIFLAKPKINEEKLLIVDGYQRIMTVFDFVENGTFRKDGKSFSLTNSDKINKKWRGKTFKELNENQQYKIKGTTIHSIIFVQIKPQNDTSFYQIFERINTSGRTLQPQEIRNCIYQGDFNSQLIILNENEKWRKLFGNEEIDPRMRDIEFILRFFAISSKNWATEGEGTISLKKFLNEFMGSNESKSQAILEQREKQFDETIDFIYQKFGENAFQNLSAKGEYTNKFNPTIFDSIMISTEIALQKLGKVEDNDLPNKRYELLQNPIYQDLIRVRTTNKERIAKRISLSLETLYGLKYE
ncbi:MAG: DUF262 domain-containing protein [Pyrinomonadaceae bacterium]|nr:DUF262 domain-containing protein [Pyrinomonadaceae bacterium]